MKILLSRWAELNFDPPPSIHTLRQWAKSGQVIPSPFKVGQKWMVEERAQFLPLEVGGKSMSARAKAILNNVSTS